MTGHKVVLCESIRAKRRVPQPYRADDDRAVRCVLEAMAPKLTAIVVRTGDQTHRRGVRHRLGGHQAAATMAATAQTRPARAAATLHSTQNAVSGEAAGCGYCRHTANRHHNIGGIERHGQRGLNLRESI